MDLANEIRAFTEGRRRQEAERAIARSGNAGSLHWELDCLTVLGILCGDSRHHHSYGPLARELYPYLRDLTSNLRGAINELRKVASALEREGITLPHTEDIPRVTIVQQMRDILGVYD